jgi:hypothetical protein
MKILPTPANIVQIEIDYLVTWNKEFKSNIIEFLIKLERDTEGQFNSKNDGTVVVIAWDGTGFFSDNRVYIRTEDRQLAQFMGHMISDSVSVSIKPFNKCDIFDNTDGVFMIDFYGGKRRKTGIETTPDNLKKIKNIELSLGC